MAEMTYREALRTALRRGALRPERVDEALVRIERLRAAFPDREN